MEPKVRRSARLSALGLTILAVGLVLAPPALADSAQPTTPGGTITIELPDGVSLAPGTYDVVISGGGGREIKTTVKIDPPPVAPSGQPAQQPVVTQVEPATVGESTDATPFLFAALAVALLALAGFLFYNRVFVRRRGTRAYVKALALFSAGKYEAALPELTSVESTLPGKRRADAKFFICFALWRLKQFDEAEHRLAALHREDQANVDVAYLLAHLRVVRRDYDGAEKVLEAIGSGPRFASDRHRKLYGVVKFHRALAAFREGRVDAAADLFETVEKLGDFRDRIPADLRNRHIVLGTQALFEKDIPRAREQFQGLERASERLDSQQRDSLLASAKLGMALAAWIEDAPDSPSTVEDLLVATAVLLDPAGRLSQTWEEGTGAADIAARLEALAGGEGRSPQERDRDRMLRDIHFLRGMTVLRTWATVEQTDVVESAATYLADAKARFACARDRDPDFSDVYLVVGLLGYYLAASEQERTAGVALLKDAQKLGTRDPEVFQVVNHYDRLQQETRDAEKAFLEEVDRYLRDPTVREEIRVDLLEQMSRYAKVRNRDTRRELISARSVPPTVAEMNDRSLLLAERLNQLIEAQPAAPGLADARKLTREIQSRAEELSERARQLEQKESDLFKAVGDHLLADEER